MPTLKHLRERIQSIQSTQKITAAMKMVAASKLRKAQDASHVFQEYAEEIVDLLHQSIAQDLRLEDWSADDVRLLKGDEGPPLFLVVSAERGLCGGYNTNLMKALRIHLNKTPDFRLAIIGRKGQNLADPLWKDKVLPLSLTEGVSFDTSVQLVQQLRAWLDQKLIGSIQCVHYSYKNVLTQELRLTPLVPFLCESVPETPVDYLTEPPPNLLMPQLLKDHLNTHVHRILLENVACEQASRMTAMDSATRNARDILARLRSTYNKTRQSQITNQLIEIISAAQAV